MAKTEVSDYQKSVQEEFNAKSVALLGGANRRNSFTFKVTDKADNVTVVKILKKDNGTEAKINDEKQSLKQIEDVEGIRVSQLVSSGEIKVKNKKFPYLVFPYYEGSTLAELVTKDSWTEQDVAAFLASLIETIMTLARAGIIHQDIKPDNIIKQADGQYIVLDLGISRFTSLEPSFVKQQGPAAYLSMEQVELGLDKNFVNQRRITFLSDLNSLGIVAVHLLAGSEFSRSWEVDRRSEAADRIRKGEIVNIEDTNLRELVASLLEPSPSTRLYKLKGALDLTGFTAKSEYKTRYWSLHKSGTGLSFIKDFAKDNPDTKLGLILSSETVNSVSNTVKVVESLLENEWDIAVDPSTYKLRFNADHHAYLKQHQYYYDDLQPEKFFDTSFTQAFVSQVVEFERSLKPTLYISPYFFISKPTDQLLAINLSLYDEAKKELTKLGDSKPLALGLSVSKSLLERHEDVDKLADQIILHVGVPIVYLNLEMTKRDNSPCKDEEYLQGVNRLVSRLSTTKQVIVSQIDQSSLGLVTNQRVSLAINPSVSHRKNDVAEKLKDEKSDQSGGPKSEDRRHRVYIPQLMNDLDISRDINNSDFATLDKKVSITGKVKSPYYTEALNIGSNDARNKHFTYEFNQQVTGIIDIDEISSKNKLQQRIEEAETAYKAISDAGIKLDADQTGDFLPVWKKIFL